MPALRPFFNRAVLAALSILAACGGPLPRSDAADGGTAPLASAGPGLPGGAASPEQVMFGRELVINRDCGACHGGMTNPASDRWLAGASGEDDFGNIGPFRYWAANLTPDPETGTGRYTPRQIFNALRYGLRPGATADVEITSMVPGQGNHPAAPNYLSPGMPWMAWRFMTDQELWAIAAYLKHGVRPVHNRVRQSDSPPDFWASEVTPAKIGTHVMPPFPTAAEEMRAPERAAQLMRGRELAASAACSACHGGALNPSQQGWLAGMRDTTMDFQIGPFVTRPRNLTPDNATGLGRFSERQIFNALRYGLRPGETPDVDVTSPVPGQGNHPANPKYLAPPMPWPAWRHMPDEDLWAIAAYLKHGVRPVRNRVQDSDGPPDFWRGEYTVEKYGAWPAPAFPTARETYTP